MTREHPCPFPQAVLDIFRVHIPAGSDVLDPFAGIGKIHELMIGDRMIMTTGIELELEWAEKHIRTIQGDATDIPWEDGVFDVIATSPAFGNRMADGYAGERCKACEGLGRTGTYPVEMSPGDVVRHGGVICDECEGSGRKLRSRRHTYRIDLGRPLSEGSGAALQWGEAYRELHERCVVEFMRVLKVGGLVLLDIKNHRRVYEEMRVTEWWEETIRRHGGRLDHVIPVDTDGLQHSGPDTNDLPENVLIFTKEH